MNRKLLKQITPELALVEYNEIPVLELRYALGEANIALQGAHLLHWQPQNQAPVLWLSEIEPFKQGNAIRGGVPICYPWFGGVKSPSHGTARIRLWQLTSYHIATNKAELELALFDEFNIVEATLRFVFCQDCTLTFTHYGQDEAQVALHSYFNIGDINKIEVQGLPTACFNSLTKQSENVPSPRQIAENVDCIYSVEKSGVKTSIIDPTLNRQIQLVHHNTSDVVLWNPWHKPTGGMSETGYQTMVCVETARIHLQLKQGEEVSLNIHVTE